MQQNKFIEELKKLGIEVTPIQLDQLHQYFELLVEWNKVMNLTGITEEEQVYLKHFYDSATLQYSVDLKEINSLCDVGTGAGFPGIVLKILFPNLNVTLVDSLEKRIKFLKHVIESLQLEKIEAIHARAEEYAIVTREKYEVVTARAVAPLNILIEYCAPMVQIGGYFIPMKANIDEEIRTSENACQQLNMKLVNIDKFVLPIENSNRTLLKFEKIGKTSKIYPRNFSDMKKKPL